MRECTEHCSRPLTWEFTIFAPCLSEAFLEGRGASKGPWFGTIQPLSGDVWPWGGHAKGFPYILTRIPRLESP